MQFPLGHHVPNQRHLEDYGSAFVNYALDYELRAEEERCGHGPCANAYHLQLALIVH